ncbi:hypothetical protein L6R52_12550 [Myxococcota bacterium]|nr:hypothetical protein [Myxococcota bacterium]
MMRSTVVISTLCLAALGVAAPARAQLVPLPPGESLTVDVPSSLVSLPVPLDAVAPGSTRGGPSARWASDTRHSRVGVGYDAIISDTILLSAAGGFSVTPSASTSTSSTGLEPVDRTWLQVAFGIGIAPPIAVLEGPVDVTLIPLGRAVLDVAFDFSDAVVPYRVRAEAGLLATMGFDFGLRLGGGVTFDYDLTHLEEERVGDAGTLHLGGSVGWLLPETSGFIEDKVPTLVMFGVTGELPIIESATRPTGVSVTLGVAL